MYLNGNIQTRKVYYINGNESRERSAIRLSGSPPSGTDYRYKGWSDVATRSIYPSDTRIDYLKTLYPPTTLFFNNKIVGQPLFP